MSRTQSERRYHGLASCIGIGFPHDDVIARAADCLGSVDEGGRAGGAPELAKRARQIYHPYSVKEKYILSHGGSSFGSPSFSPLTGLLYITGKDAAVSFTVPRAIRASPLTYRVGGRQYVGVVASNSVVALGLP